MTARRSDQGLEVVASPKVAEKKYSGAESVHRRAESQVAIHLQRREPDVHAIKIGDDVEQEHERDESPADAA